MLMEDDVHLNSFVQDAPKPIPYSIFLRRLDDRLGAQQFSFLSGTLLAALP